MTNRVGNDQLKVMHENKDQLAKQIADWQRDRDLIQQRLHLWTQLVALLKFAADLPVAAERALVGASPRRLGGPCHPRAGGARVETSHAA